MKVKIEDYRGFEISFDNEGEVFYTLGSSWDVECTKKSYAAVKKWIDDYIKDNSEFKPFFIEQKESSWKEHKKLKIIGIRKDGRFVFENSKGEKEQLSEYDEKDYILYNPDNDAINAAINELKLQRDAIDKLIDAERKKITGTPLKELKKQYIV